MDANKKANRFWLATVICAFAGMISFFQINSYSADKHHLNGFWTVAGIVFTVGALFSVYKVSQNANTGKD